MKRRDLLSHASALGAVWGTTRGAKAQSQTGAASVTPAKPVAPSERIRIGMIGVGSFGQVNLRDFQVNPDVEVVAVCDVDSKATERAVGLTGGKAKPYKDYRQLLADKTIQAVVVSTPEHWHALMTIDACDAGKDVYVEKPASHHIRDGRLMVEAARRNKRVVQVGSQQRSGSHFQRAVKYVREGRLGDINFATCWNHSPAFVPRPLVKGPAPAHVDWDMYLGPAAVVPYDVGMNVGRRGSWEFWGGWITEWGAHLADVVLWAMNATAPEQVVAVGGKFWRKEGEIPDTLQVSYRFPKFVFHYSLLQPNTFGLNGDVGAARFGSYGIQFHGTKGTLFVDRNGFRITPQTMRKEEANPPPPGSGHDSRQTGFYYTTEIQAEQSESSQQHGPHVRNFLDCVKSRKRPNADIEDGHNTNTVCRLGNIAYRVGRALKWDGAKERIIGDDEANKLAVGSYRDPWKPKGL